MWLFKYYRRVVCNRSAKRVHQGGLLIDPVEQAEWLRGGDASLRLQRLLPNEQLEIRPQGHKFAAVSLLTATAPAATRI
jgi:hypothetical protein